MEQKKELTMDLIKSLMEPSYTLVWVSRDSSFDSCHDTIEECLGNKNAMMMLDKSDEWYADVQWLAIRDIIGQLKSDCIDRGFDEDYVNEFMDRHDDELMDAISARDDSDVLGTLLGNTADIPVTVEMLSNYDCINSHWLESRGGYVYPGSYFGDMVDALNLNPAKVKRSLTEKGIRVYGRYPDRKSRNGRELVSYEDFHRELVNSGSGANMLTYLGKVNVKELYESGFNIARVVIPQGNRCGIFSSMYGGGSIMDMTLRHDATIDLKTGNGHSYCHRLKMDIPQKYYGHSIRQVYGVRNSFFGDTLQLFTSNN
ncbi:MAG: hypothetical protein NC388_02705 [Clostridium sp.]|nr:hypothetical protein [Clostridium sp.]